jgi:hypothetical protein
MVRPVAKKLQVIRHILIASSHLRPVAVALTPKKVGTEVDTKGAVTRWEDLW